MGQEVEAKCLDCGKKFQLAEGGGFFFHLLRCDSCGKTKSISFDQLGELHIRYETDSQGTISEDEYNRGVEQFAGKCKCQGNYTFNAPPRCPKCHSVKIEETGEGDSIMYD